MTSQSMPGQHVPKLLKVNKSGSITYAGKPCNKTAVNKDSPYAITHETDRMVTGMFKNVECPGQPGTVTMRLYKGMQPFHKTMLDGETYTIPLSVAMEINKSCKYPRDKHMLDEQGNNVKGPGIPIDKFMFVTMDFQTASNAA
jgi:hypothetical protein